MQTEATRGHYDYKQLRKYLNFQVAESSNCSGSSNKPTERKGTEGDSQSFDNTVFVDDSTKKDSYSYRSVLLVCVWLAVASVVCLLILSAYLSTQTFLLLLLLFSRVIIKRGSHHFRFDALVASGFSKHLDTFFFVFGRIAGTALVVITWSSVK